MIDKISGNSSAGYTSEASRVAARNATPAPLPGAPGVAGRPDELSLSGEARALQRISRAVEEAPEVRTELVDKLRAQVESGEYQVDATRLAGRLLGLLE